MGKESARVCLYVDHLAGALDEFCRTVWPNSHQNGQLSSPTSGPKVSSGDLKTQAAPTFLFLKEEKVIGHVATIPVRLSTVSGVVSAHWIVGFMVLPEYRNGLVGPLLIKEVNRVLDCALSLHVEAPVLRILTGLQWVHKGVLPQYLRVLNAEEVMKNLQLSSTGSMGPDAKRWVSLLRSQRGNAFSRWIGSIGLAYGQMLWSGLTFLLRAARVQAEVREEHGFDESYTELWQSVAGQFQAAIVRDQASLQARFGRRLDRYRLLACRQGNRLMGYCILKMKSFSNDLRMMNMKVGTIVDCLYDPAVPSILQSLMTHASQCFERENAHVILCTASLRSIRRVLLTNGFFRIPGNLNFAYHNRLPTAIDQVSIECWHLMRGDSDADQNF